MMLHMVAPDLGFGGGWDPESKRLYIVHNNDAKVHEQIAANINDPKLAALLIEMWCRGYRSRARELNRTPGAKHYHMFAEGELFGDLESLAADEKATTQT